MAYIYMLNGVKQGPYPNKAGNFVEIIIQILGLGLRMNRALLIMRRG